MKSSWAPYFKILKIIKLFGDLKAAFVVALDEESYELSTVRRIYSLGLIKKLLRIIFFYIKGQ